MGPTAICQTCSRTSGRRTISDRGAGYKMMISLRNKKGSFYEKREKVVSSTSSRPARGGGVVRVGQPTEDIFAARAVGQ